MDELLTDFAEMAKAAEEAGLPKAPWILCRHDNGEWFILDVTMETVADGIKNEAVARAIAAIPANLAARASIETEHTQI